jgi:hypothetical protein
MNTVARPSLLSRTAQLFAAQARVYCLSALVAGALGITALTVVSTLVVYNAGSNSFDAMAVWKSMAFSRQMTFIFGLIFALWSPILLAARGVCRTTADHLAGQPISLSNVLADMARFIPAAMIYALIIGLPMMIGFSILVVPGIVVAAVFVLVVPASVNESLGIFAALRRGFSLGLRVLNKELAFTFACAALVLVLIVLRIVFFDRLLPSTYRFLFAVRFALTYIPALLVLILANISFTLLYHEARALEASAAPGPPSTPQP